MAVFSVFFEYASYFVITAVGVSALSAAYQSLCFDYKEKPPAVSSV